MNRPKRLNGYIYPIVNTVNFVVYTINSINIVGIIGSLYLSM
ncbi:MAG TPA: hypothetical protein VGM30_12690 [Puia sp.]|jgi:hypothetical protein